MINYQIDPALLTQATAEKAASLAANNPGVDFTTFAAGVIYARLKNNIQHYRVYGPYWWALKAVLRRQGYNVGNESDEYLEPHYSGATDTETITAADMFYEDMAGKVLVTNNSWQLHPQKEDYILYDSDMEERRSVTDPIES